MPLLSTKLEDWIWSAVIVAGSALVALLAYWILFLFLRRFAARTRSVFNQSLVRRTAAPVKLILPLLAVFATLPNLAANPAAISAWRHALSLVLIALFAWATVRMFDVVQDVISTRYRHDVAGDFTARRINTQVQVLRRIAILLVVVVAAAAMLMTFPQIWNIGATLFASAGVAGVIAGMAARPTLTNLLAGIQIALSEPIRLGDAVVVEGEWGTIEEIGSAYVVIRLWDLRRLLVPLSYFVEKPFQNWTRNSTALMATVFLITNYSVPVEEVRREYRRILESSGLWDGKQWALDVTNANEKGLELRALMSAPNSTVSWDLRCHVRERLIGFLQQRYPQSLPATRVEVHQVPLIGPSSPAPPA